MVEEDRRKKLPSNFEARKQRAEWTLQEEEKRKQATERVCFYLLFSKYEGDPENKKGFRKHFLPYAPFLLQYLLLSMSHREFLMISYHFLTLISIRFSDTDQVSNDFN